MAAAITDAGRGVPVGSASAHIALARASSALTDADEGAAGSLADRVGQDGTENPPATAKATDNRVAASLDRSCQTGASRPRSANAATADPASNGNAISRAATASPGPAADGTPIIRQCQALPRPPPRAAWAQATTSAGKSGNVRISGCSLSANCASAACIARPTLWGPARSRTRRTKTKRRTRGVGIVTSWRRSAASDTPLARTRRTVTASSASVELLTPAATARGRPVMRSSRRWWERCAQSW